MDLPVVIVGSGFSCLCAGILLKKAGIHDFTILEKASGLGGTWRANTYPGAACDVQSHLYSYSFEPNPGWSRSFSQQHEILDLCIAALLWPIYDVVKLRLTLLWNFQADREWLARNAPTDAIRGAPVARHRACNSPPRHSTPASSQASSPSLFSR